MQDFRTERLILREFREDDFDALRALETCPETHYYERGTPTEEQTREFLAQAQLQRQVNPRRTRYDLALVLPGEDRVIGRLKLCLNWEEIDEWEIGWALHPHYWKRGYITESARALLAFAFETLRVHRVVAYCNANNVNSYSVMRRLHMRQDGRLRDTVRFQGGWTDEFVYAILERDWAELQQRGDLQNE